MERRASKSKVCTNKVITSLQDDGINTSVDADIEELDYVDDVLDGSNIEDESSLMPTTSRERRSLDKSNVEDLDDEELKNLPRVKNLFNQFWEEKMKEMKEKGNLSNVDKSIPSIKSPSDTTIYAPALCKSPPMQVINVMQNCQAKKGVSPLQHPQGMTQVNDMISTFVDTMRMDHEQQLHENERHRSSMDEGGKLRSAQECAEHAVIEAEKFCATVSNPGNLSNLDKFMQTEQNEENDQQHNLQNLQMQNLQIPNIGSGVSDDDFFHLTCHIEPNLIHKIEKGEFVELEKLLPKEKFGKNGGDN